jgi:2,3-bisphosphoglycerate-independent phosphoglycerate mutase
LPPVIVVFLDGLGLAPAGEHNPFSHAVMPAVQRLLGGPLLPGTLQADDGLLFAALDTLLGVPGMPQSATGQTALFTGVNAAALIGYHRPAYPNAQLTDVIHQHNILRRAVDAGHGATFANAYSQEYFDKVKRENRRMSVTTHSVLGAGIPFRWLSDLEHGEAVYWDITGEHIRLQRGIDLPTVTPEQAGANLARVGRTSDLVLFECFLPDLIGHRKDLSAARGFLNLLDRFLDSLWRAIPPDTTSVVCSDHGNLEDLSRGIHTVNPAPLLVKGPGAGAFAAARSLIDVAGPVLAVLDNRFQVASELCYNR